MDLINNHGRLRSHPRTTKAITRRRGACRRCRARKVRCMYLTQPDSQLNYNPVNLVGHLIRKNVGDGKVLCSECQASHHPHPHAILLFENFSTKKKIRDLDMNVNILNGSSRLYQTAVLYHRKHSTQALKVAMTRCLTLPRKTMECLLLISNSSVPTICHWIFISVQLAPP